MRHGGGSSDGIKQRITIRRIVWSIVAVGLLVAAVFMNTRYRSGLSQVEKWRNEDLLTATVNLSEPGTFTGIWEQGDSLAHGVRICLTVAENGVSGRSPAELLEGLAGTISVTGSGGEGIFSEVINSEWNAEGEAEGPIMLAYLSGFLGGGDYTLDIQVRSGAEALSETEQTISVKYFLCGPEGRPAVIAGLPTLVVGVPGAIISVCVMIGFIRYGVRTAGRAGTRSQG